MCYGDSQRATRIRVAPVKKQQSSGVAQATPAKPLGNGRVRAVSLASEPICSGNAAALFYPLDVSYSLVDFFGDGPSGSGPATSSNQENDDDSATVPLPFVFNLYGVDYTACYVNNNGNISFTSSYSTYTAAGFPVDDYPMIAAFWGDVDTRGGLGSVRMKFLDSNSDGSEDTLIVTWDNVGYYSYQGDKRNTFQIAISDGTNPQMGGNNVLFSYDNMCWTTGGASGGSDGFGGSPATVGANRGNGVDYFLIGRFNQPGGAYDGPYDANDGIDYLDYKLFLFNTDTSEPAPNIPPIASDFPAGNAISVNAGDTLALTVNFLSPELGQTTTVGVEDLSGAVTAGLNLVATPGNVASVALSWTPDVADAGIYELKFTATDDAAPAGVTIVTLTIEVVGCTAPVSLCTPSNKVSNITRYYRALTGTSDCYPCDALRFFVGDTATPNFVAGPFACEDVVRISRGAAARVLPGKFGVAGIITVVGQATVWAVDPDDRVGAPVVCP